MYSPKRYFTKQVISDVLAEFEWPAAYTVDDEGLPDDITVVFPGCSLVFDEGFESDMRMRFDLPGFDKLFDLGAAMRSLRDGVRVPETPGLSGYFSPGASLEKVQHELRDICRTVHTHFRNTLLGDKSWVAQYEVYESEGRAMARAYQDAATPTEVLVRELRDETTETRVRAVQELARRGAVEATGSVVDACADPRNADVRAVFESALASLEDAARTIAGGDKEQ